MSLASAPPGVFNEPETPAVGRIPLLEADPELLRHVAPDQVDRARRSLVVPLLVVPPGPLDPAELFSHGRRTFAAMIVSGMVTQELTLMAQPALRLLGPGELIPGRPPEGGLLAAEHSWAATTPTRLALLDDHLLRGVQHWPRLLPALMERALDTQGGAVSQLAISHQPRVEDRLVGLFRALADRWGRVTSSGVVVTLSLTHEALGRMIGARRPTVTLALSSLGDQERLVRREDGSWLLTDVDERNGAAASRPVLTTSQRPRPVVSLAPEPDRPPLEHASVCG